MKTPTILSHSSAGPIVRLILAWFCLQFLWFTSAQANVLSWTGSSGTTSFWNDSANWGFLGTPGNGDTVIFPGGVSRLSNTNNIANLTLAQIRFVGPAGSYTLYGNPLTLTNSLDCTNASGAHTIYFSITNSAPGSPTNVTIDVGSGVTLTMSGTIYGTAAVTKTDAGTLTYQASGDNFYTNTTFVNAGILYLNVSGDNAVVGPLVIGDGSGTGSPIVRYLQNGELNFTIPTPITINQGGLLDLNNHQDTIGTNFTLNGGTIQTGSGILYFGNGTVVTESGSSSVTGNLNIGATTCTFSNSGSLSISASISGSATVMKNDPGSLTFSGVNTYTGETLVQQGYFYAEGPYTLGSTNSSIIVSNNASLVMNGGSYGITNKTVILYGVAPDSNYGALDSESSPGVDYWEGPVVLEGATTFDPYYPGTDLRISGPISGPGSVTVGVSGSTGEVFYYGTPGNSYAGPTTVAADTTLLLDGPYATIALPGNVDIIGTLRVLSSLEINNAASVQVESTGLLDFAGTYADIDTLTGSGTVNFESGGYLTVGVMNGSSTFDGPITGPGYPGGITLDKAGSGTFTLNGTNTYLNATEIDAGTLVVNDPQPQSPVAMYGGTLSGTGTVGNITSPGGGTVQPGPESGILTCSNATWNSSTELSVNISGPTYGTGYSALYCAGSNYINNANLLINSSLTTPVSVGDPLYIIQAPGGIGGTFNGTPSGTTFDFGGVVYRLDYHPAYVTLTVTNIQAAQAGFSVSGGNGNHSIDPNECNDLYLVVSNYSESPMNNVVATLYSDTAHVFVTQPVSAFPNIAPGTATTNLTAFQITTLPDFPCSSYIDLTLSVYSSESAINLPIVLTTGSTGAPVEFDNNNLTTIPMTPGVALSTNMVSGISSPVQKVTVALYAYYPFDASLTNLLLISPDGTAVSLSAANGGSGAGYGTSCSARTVFDDAAGTSITTGTAPFVGTFQPQTPLAAFIGKSGAGVNGAWRLQIGNGFSGSSSGTLFCWSLFISPTDCSGGSGVCSACYGLITNTVNTSSKYNSAEGRLLRAADTPPTCESPTECPGPEYENCYYNVHSFTNDGPATCVTIYLDDPAGYLFSSAYVGNYDTNNVCNNYLGDLRDDQQETGVFSVQVPAQTNFVVVVNDVADDDGGTPNAPYTLLVTSGNCPESLNIARNPAVTNTARIFWSSSGGGYRLERTSPSLTNTSWTVVTNQPIINGSYYNVTNGMGSTNTFYRLHSLLQ